MKYLLILCLFYFRISAEKKHWFFISLCYLIATADIFCDPLEKVFKDMYLFQKRCCPLCDSLEDVNCQIVYFRIDDGDFWSAAYTYQRPRECGENFKQYGKRWTFKTTGIQCVSQFPVSVQIGGYLSVVSLSPIKGPLCFLEQETLLSLLSTGWFQEWIRAWFTEANHW